MRVTVCELPDQVGETAWTHLIDHATAERPDILLLPEMPFSPWIAATDAESDAGWSEAVGRHDTWHARFAELQVPTVTGSRPVWDAGARFNEAFVWTADGGYLAVHRKHYLPDEPGFWEATWYQRGDGTFITAPAGDTSLGFLVCTEIWFTEHARSYARQGAGLVLCPRATEITSADKWIAGGRAAAVMGGAFCLSSNRTGAATGMTWGGNGWIIDPDGVVLAVTSPDDPIITREIDIDVADAAKTTYPRYVLE